MLEEMCNDNTGYDMYIDRKNRAFSRKYRGTMNRIFMKNLVFLIINGGGYNQDHRRFSKP